MASMAFALDLGELTALADRIVVAEVLSVSSRWETGRRRIVSDIEVNIAESWKGTMPTSKRVTIIQPGGAVGDIEMRVHGLASFRAGERAVLFLRGSEASSTVVGMGQGMRRLSYDSPTGRWLVLGGDRTAAVVRRADGGFVAAPPEATDSLTALRTRVRALVQR